MTTDRRQLMALSLAGPLASHLARAQTSASSRAAPAEAPEAAVHADGMRILWGVPIAMDDGVVLRADILLPRATGRYAAILSYGPYGRGLAFQAGYKT